MTDVQTLDRAYHFILTTFVARGDPPHYTELAAAFGLAPEGGKALLHELLGTGIPCWAYPDTDYIASFAPFNAQPTQYRLFVDGEPRGYAQCGFEALAACWLFPGRVVTVRAPGLDGGAAAWVELRDGKLLRSSDPVLVAYVDLHFADWPKNRAYA